MPGLGAFSALGRISTGVPGVVRFAYAHIRHQLPPYLQGSGWVLALRQAEMRTQIREYPDSNASAGENDSYPSLYLT